MSTLRLLLALASFSIPLLAHAAAEGPRPSLSLRGGPRIRPADARSATLLLDGLRRSPTLRALVDRIETGDVIVYIETWPGLVSHSSAGKLTWVTATPEFRYVRVSLNPQIIGNFAIAVLGHELQHVLEVVEAPSIVDHASLSKFYSEHGISVRGGRDWDSELARDVGESVRQDLLGVPSIRGDASARDFEPSQWLVVYRRARGAGAQAR